jgi:hypothetical protein
MGRFPLKQGMSQALRLAMLRLREQSMSDPQLPRVQKYCPHYYNRSSPHSTILPLHNSTRPRCPIGRRTVSSHQCKGLRKVCQCLVTGLYSMKKKTCLRCYDTDIRLACRSRSISKLPQCRGSSESSTEDHHSILALARYIKRAFTLVSC